MINDVLKDAQFVAQHVELFRQIETMMEDMVSAQQGGQPGLDISLLVQQLEDGRVDIEIRDRARHARGAFAGQVVTVYCSRYCCCCCYCFLFVVDAARRLLTSFRLLYHQVQHPSLRTCCRRRNCPCPWLAPWIRAAE
jgi:hypothetical protein